MRGPKVLLEADLAALYGVETRALDQAAKRNTERFPADFMFQLSAAEFEDWRSQAVMSNPGAKMGLRRALYPFTEDGALMATTALNSKRAVQTNLYVVRASVPVRKLVASNKDLARRLDQLEKKLGSHDPAVASLAITIRNLMAPLEPRRRPTAFVNPEEKHRG